MMSKRNELEARSHGFFVEPARVMHAPGYVWGHEVRVALPASYRHTTFDYPVLWISDNALETALPELEGLEVIVVSIGSPTDSSDYTFCRRRIYDFYPREDFYPPGPPGDFMRERDRVNCFPERPFQGGGAPAFLEFLVGDVRQALGSEYRMDPLDHCLEGYSAGGWFVLYALFSRSQAFTRYVAGSPALYFCNNMLFDIEAEYAATHDDLRGELFLGVGGRELTDDHVLGCFSSTAKMVETLLFRGYRSLHVSARIFPDEAHATTRAPTVGWGVRAAWGERLHQPSAARTAAATTSDWRGSPLA
jgi:predicted alpha/beta superfamily hydrolase